MIELNASELKAKVFQSIHRLVEAKELVVKDATVLIGDGSVVDSMKLVELCLALEDIAAEHGFTFDWTSEAAMSRSRSMFRTAGALTEEFIRQARSTSWSS